LQAAPEEVVAYLVEANGRTAIVPASRAEASQGKGRPVLFSEELGKRLFYAWVCAAIQLAIKRVRPEAYLGGCSRFSDEVRVDFYDFEEQWSEDAAEKILSEAARLLKGGMTLRQVSKHEILEILKRQREILLFEDVKQSDSDVFQVVTDGSFSVLCSDECVEQVYRDPVIELVNRSVVHWRGYEKSLTLKRLHFRAYPSRTARSIQLEFEKEYSLRDHVNLGKELDLFITDNHVGAGLILWAPNGAIVRKLMEEFEYKLHLKYGYQPVVTPHMALGNLFEVSGHLSHYRENMYVFEHDGKTHVVKPMNCPFHILLFKRKKWSYKELPVRYFEFGTVYRYERAGTLHGLTRVRGLTQDDSHIFLRPDQIQDEIGRILELISLMYQSYGIRDYSFKLSLRDPSDSSKYIGSPEVWEEAERALEEALVRHGIPFRKEVGEAAFYGPKIDIYLKDSLGREWQCGTIQLDFNLPERFDLTYIDRDNREKRVVIIHRALIGSIERFLGILLEYYAGRLPLWLSPVQVAVLPVEEENSAHLDFASSLVKGLEAKGIRARLLAEGRLQARIREARSLRVPLIVVIGDREIKTGELEATWIKYSTDERGRYRPVEERLSFKSLEDLANWVKAEVGRETHGIL